MTDDAAARAREVVEAWLADKRADGFVIPNEFTPERVFFGWQPPPPGTVSPSLVDRIAAFAASEREAAALEEAAKHADCCVDREEVSTAARDAKIVCEGFDHGLFVRGTSRDAEASWALRLLPYAAALGRLARFADRS